MTEEKKSNCITEVYSRITGYFQQTKGWNMGKKEEFKDRKHFDKSVKGIANNDKKVHGV